MYESITYKELKSLPREQKIEALKELKALYPTQKKIAEKLGVNPANIYNMIAKYIKADEEGQPTADVKTVKEKAVNAGAVSMAEVGPVQPEPGKTRVRHVKDKKRNLEESFQFTVAKNLTGEEAQYLFAGIGGTFLKNHDYRIEIRISER